MSNDIIYLNVGGIYYDTTLNTLLSVQDSFFTSLFNGKYSLTYDRKQRVFIDRDGRNFRYILNYLRNGEINIKNEIIKQEFMYYFPKLELLNEKRLVFVGFARWEYNVNYTIEECDERMKKAASEYFSNSRPLTMKEYKDRIEIENLPEYNSSKYTTTLISPDNFAITDNKKCLLYLESRGKLYEDIIQQCAISTKRNTLCVIEK